MLYWILVKKETYCQSITEEYEELREEHFSNLQDFTFLSLDHVRTNAFTIDWTAYPPAQKPNHLGTHVLNVDLHNVIPYIDWDPFFQVWQLRGRYPNRGYPKIFQDENVGKEAQKLYDEAQMMIDYLLDKHHIQGKCILALYPANSVGDDIHVYEDDERTHFLGTFHGLRQQVERDERKTFACLSDFIAPLSTGLKDYIGFFAVSTGFGIQELCERYKEENDDFNGIMVEAIADRLAEALAEYLHTQVRRYYWGYAPNEELSIPDIIKVKYQGIRPAPGYPTQPDHTEKSTMWKLFQVTEKTGIQLTESLAMLPAASVCGLYFSHPQSHYFSLGKIQKDQVIDYAIRKNKELSLQEKWLAPILNYDI